MASTSSGQCWSLTTYCPVPGPVPTSPANNDYKPGFAAALMLKDLKLAQEAALAAGAATPLGAQAAQIYDLFNKAGHAGTSISPGSSTSCGTGIREGPDVLTGQEAGRGCLTRIAKREGCCIAPTALGGRPRLRFRPR